MCSCVHVFYAKMRVQEQTELGHGVGLGGAARRRASQSKGERRRKLPGSVRLTGVRQRRGSARGEVGVEDWKR